jgi:hypothetical protein
MCLQSPTTPAKTPPPANATEYFATYADGLWALGSVLKPVRKIVFAIMEREALDYEQAIHYLVGEYFVAPYAKYVEKYLRQGKDVDFDAWCRIEFTYRVRRGFAYSAKQYRLACERGMVTRGIDQVEQVESHVGMQTQGDQLAAAVLAEWEADQAARSALVMATLQGLEPIESYVVWNHAALGHTYDDVASSLGISPTTAKKIYVGVTARLRREAGGC